MSTSESTTVKSSQVISPNLFHQACAKGDSDTAKNTFHPDYLYATDANGNTALHVASMNGHANIVRFLFRYYWDIEKRNKQNLTAEQLAQNVEIKELFQRSNTRFISEEDDLEWIDSYKNAYRIAYENREHLKRWLIKVPLEKLLEKLSTDYIDKLDVEELKVENKKQIQEYMSVVLEDEALAGLISIYTEPWGFYRVLNRNLAEIGSNFRFRSTQDLFDSGYSDNEPPQDLGQHIYAALVMYHPEFYGYYSLTGKTTTYRGMTVTESDLKQYRVGDYVLTRSFLSSSLNEKLAVEFRAAKSTENAIPVACKYTICNPRSALNIPQLNRKAKNEEQEILIVPFVVFEITKITRPANGNGPVEIELIERDENSYIF